MVFFSEKIPVHSGSTTIGKLPHSSYIYYTCQGKQIRLVDLLQEIKYAPKAVEDTMITVDVFDLLRGIGI
jgi:hypothetical protein